MMPLSQATQAAITRLLQLMPQEPAEFPLYVPRETYDEIIALLLLLTQQIGPKSVQQVIDIHQRIEEAQQRIMAEHQEPEQPFTLQPEP